jgi:integrase/recombinase XerD
MSATFVITPQKRDMDESDRREYIRRVQSSSSTIGAEIPETITVAGDELELDDLMLDDGFIRLRVRKGGGQTVVPIDEETIQALERYQVMRTDHETAYLFTSMRGNRVSKQPVRRAIKDAAVEAGVMEEGENRFHKKFTPHTFRTVFTTLMRNQEMSNHVLKYIRGDSDNQTMDIYTRVDREDAREQYLNCIKILGL